MAFLTGTATLLAVPSIASGGEPGSARVLIRKDAQDLSTRERRDYVDAVLRLKSVRSPYDRTLTYYDQFVVWHRELSRCDPNDPLLADLQMAHAGPMFLAWHRQFVLLFERALRRVSGKRIATPYWDWTDPQSTKAVFSRRLMGGNGNPDEGYAIDSGPFRRGRWQLNIQSIGLQWASSRAPYITRNFGSFPAVELPTQEDVRAALRAPRYDVAPYGVESDASESFRNALEGWRNPIAGAIICGPDGVIAEVQRPPIELHNAVHIWVGGQTVPEAGPGKMIGTMFNVTTSPNDPVFFLHHAMVDRVWARWQKRYGVHTYLPRSGYRKNSVDDVMRPFDQDGIRVTPGEVANSRRLGYRYDSRGRGGGQKDRTGRGTSRQAGLAALQSQIRFQCGLPGA